VFPFVVKACGGVNTWSTPPRQQRSLLDAKSYCNVAAGCLLADVARQRGITHTKALHQVTHSLERNFPSRPYAVIFKSFFWIEHLCDTPSYYTPIPYRYEIKDGRVSASKGDKECKHFVGGTGQIDTLKLKRGLTSGRGKVLTKIFNQETFKFLLVIIGAVL